VEHDPNQETQKERKLRWRPTKKQVVRFSGTLVTLAVLGFLIYFSIPIALDPQLRGLARWSPILFTGLLVLAVLIRLGYRFKWTGFGEDVQPKVDTQDIRRAKTLWDWLQLLIIPAVLAFGGVLLTQSQDERQRALEEQRAQDTALQAFIDEIGSSLVNEDLRDPQSDEARSVARARALTILERLVPTPEVRQTASRPGKGKGTSEDAASTVLDRRKTVLQFLYESGLINKENPVVSLRGANLREADLKELNLSGADLSGADMFGIQTMRYGPEGKGIDLSDANLSSADLSAADLGKADLSGANLSGTVLGSLLCDADLSNADLSGADLRRARQDCITQDK
jgi:uncharacterized protein YjbI with pentapeptide repeats